VIFFGVQGFAFPESTRAPVPGREPVIRLIAAGQCPVPGKTGIRFHGNRFWKKSNRHGSFAASRVTGSFSRQKNLSEKKAGESAYRKIKKARFRKTRITAAHRTRHKVLHLTGKDALPGEPDPQNLVFLGLRQCEIQPRP